MSELMVKIKKLTSNGLFIAIVIGMVIRLLLIPFSLEFDTNYWTIVIRNIESGNGLYLMEGYYYTPVWGYILGFVAAIKDTFLGIGDLSRVCYDLVSYVMADHYAYTDMGVSIVFLFMLKLILWLSDLTLSVLVYQLVDERTEDKRKAIIAFVLVFVCPHVIGASSMIVMPDTLSAMFTMLTIVLLKKDKYILAGVCYSLAVWVKFFPIAIILVLLCYIYVGSQGDNKDAMKKIAKAIIGFMATSAVIFLPQIMEGTIVRSMAFLTDRFIEIVNNGLWAIICALLVIALIIVIVMHVSKHMLKAKGNMDDRMMEYSLILLGICMLYYTNMQYLVTLIPFLVYCLMIVDYRYNCIWILLAVAGFILTFALNTNAVMLNSLVVYTDMISSDAAKWLFNILNEERLFGYSIVDMYCTIADKIQKVSLFGIIFLFVIRRIKTDRIVSR